MYKLYSVYDSVAQQFYAPTMERNDATATRSFLDLMQDGRFKLHNKDYDLYRIGAFDPETGVIDVFDRALVARGDQYIYEEDDLFV